jgi:hypothetical protein
VTSPFPGYTPHVTAKPKTLSRQKKDDNIKKFIAILTVKYLLKCRFVGYDNIEICMWIASFGGTGLGERGRDRRQMLHLLTLLPNHKLVVFQ